MMSSFASRFNLTLLFLALSSTFVLAEPSSHTHIGLHHHAGNVSKRSLQKRFPNARFTFFDTGLGACGSVNQASDFVSNILFPNKRLTLHPT